ncbi:two-component system phosphate regulon sensor histidine kinase PhoR [Microvirga flocculans]|uniref:histidine kinase n=1 Tax=Microvirga flocculans TaxID=217168 RepID=A0A7W6IHW8_9HYPH|nr:ATP-binding protein [Microvirga flocculans]MBB4041189.1 two-component system phosphate regulon sensor histidine kinase PhoR [Microvirga flocculans]
MSDPDDSPPEAVPQRSVSIRHAALRGAVVSCFVLVSVALVRGQGDLWLLLWAAIAVLAGLAVAGPKRRLTGGVRAQTERPQRSSIAEAVLAQIPDPVILVDQRAVVLEANKAAFTLLAGLKPSHPLSFALRSPDVLDGIQTVLETGEPMKVEYSERIPTERTFEVHIGPLQTDVSHAEFKAGVVLFFRDLTSARRLEAMRADFVANASHELRTPLASVLGFIETIQGPARDDLKARERFLEIMKGQAERMKRLIDDLLSLSRIEMRAHLSPTQTVDLASIVAQMVETLSPLARERNVVIEARFPDRPAVVLGDRDELLRVAENLIENAVKYGESGGKVDVEVAHAGPSHGEAGPHIVFDVRDYGPGIAPEHLPRLTERFYRADAAQSRDKGGTGLGLAIVKHIVNRHRGHFDIASELGQGARFTVTLPEAGASR